MNIKTPPNAPPPAHHPAAIPPAAHPRRRGEAASRCTAQTARSRFRPETARSRGPSASSLTKTTISLPVLERLLHKVKGKFQRVSWRRRPLPSRRCTWSVERAAHRVKRLVGVQTVVKAALHAVSSASVRAAGRGLVGQQRPGGLVGLQLGAVGIAPLGKQVGRGRRRAAGTASA